MEVPEVVVGAGAVCFLLGYGAAALVHRLERRAIAVQLDRDARLRTTCPHDRRDPMEGSTAGWRVRPAGVGRVVATCVGCGRSWEYQRDGEVIGEVAPERLPVGWRDWWA